MAVDTLKVPRVILSSVQAAVGRSLVHIGLIHELRRRGVSVSSAVVGPHLAQAMLIRRLSGRYVRCLDERLLSPDQILAACCQLGVGSDLLLIEGSSGLFDGFCPGGYRGSDAELANMTRSPVALIVDVRGFGSGLGALVKGCCALADGYEILGVIANQVEVSDPNNQELKDRAFYDNLLQRFGLPSLIGALPSFGNEIPIPRAGHEQLSWAPLLPRQFFIDLGTLVREFVNVEELQRRASRAPAIQVAALDEKPFARRSRIAVSDDSCFNLCVQDNLDLMRHYGAEIVPFSPLADAGLPRKIGAVYLTEANLAEYGRDLAENGSMLQSLRDFANAGGAIYAEGSGAAYLCRSFRCSAGPESVPGVGILAGSAVQSSGSFDYTEAITIEESILGRPGLMVKGLTASRWELREEDSLVCCMRLSLSGRAPKSDGFSPGAQIVATFGFLHFGSCPDMAKNIVDAAEVVQRI